VILADTSIWVDYLRRGNPDMEKNLSQGQIVMHPFIVAEIALGSLRSRRQRLEELEALLEVKVAQLGEVRHMIESRALYAKGIGLTDAHLLASCLMTPGTQLWTLDGALKKIAKALGIVVY
jgi:predicted nucleic acid-binding protein